MTVPNKIMFLDLEVDNRPYYGALASPRHPQNYVVAPGWAIDETPYSGKVEGAYYHSKAEADKWLSIPDDVWLLVAHNAPFEMDWALVDQNEEIMRFLARGGRIFCTAYAHYLLSNQQDTYPSLDEIAPMYGGTHKVDGIKILWEQGYLTSQIDKDLLLEYLLGPEGDIENTRKVFYGEYMQLVQRGMWDMALERMEGMLYNCFAMHAGLFVNRDVAQQQLEIGEARLLELRKLFESHRQQFPEDCVFKESSDYHMSAWLFGGPVKYKARKPSFTADGAPKYEKMDAYQHADGKYVDCAVWSAMDAGEADWELQEHGELVKYKAGINKGQVKIFRVDSERPLLVWKECIYDAPGIVPLGKLPQDILKSFKNDFAGKRVLADGSPVYSSGKDCLDMLAKRQEFPEDVRAVLAFLLEFAKVDKDIGTYYLREEKDEDGNVIKQSGMLQYLTDASIVHHVLNCTSTVTGRLSSNRPNMQNIPRGDTSDVKKMFTSRFGDDGYIIEADYSALEVVCLAAFSKDTNLTKALLDGIDMHCMRLAKQLGEPYEDVLRKCKDENDPQHKQYKTWRTNIKPKAFAYQYGATAHGIAFATGCTVEDAQAFIDAEKALFPEVESFYDEVITPEVNKDRKMHREQTDSGAWRIYYTGTWQSEAGTTYQFREYPKTQFVDGQRVETMDFKPTQIRNYPIQGESGFFVQGIAGLVVRWFIKNNFFDGKAFIINQVHDALYFDVHKDVLEEVCTNVKRMMESLPEYFSKKYGYTLDVPFPAEVEYGSSMYEKKHFSPTH